MTQKEPSRPEPTNVLLEGIVGSTAYGLATPESDIDRRGIFMEPPATLLSLSGFPVKKQTWNGSKADGDRELTEVGKFCSLALSGNPTYTELLWLPDDLYVTRTPLGDELIQMRKHFLSARAARNSYFGYAEQQFLEFAKRKGQKFSSDTGNRTEKHARHMARLLFQGYQLWALGRVIVRLPTRIATECRVFGELVAAEPAEFSARLWDFLKTPEGIGSWLPREHNKVPRTGIDLAEALLEHYEGLFNSIGSVLPDQPNREVVDSWLTNRRLEQAQWS